ncbi:MAG: YjjG family noncanonical pyrimidine nucleotidase [Salegentibacter sp.]|uniref:Putative hydrolase of the HAD superfamily n=1 Tax=Salegentibacter flavus TaxID=287099 RepID=A0A1I4XQF3_9FLAO|nr:MULTISPECIES: YjjG family noncanonical pyrimidine nucleotidase [Salegentibacter]MDR9456387.1 YjjG family noncanonical pyrimidine nucleotidase [Salegentibacter sp.]SFN28022.1 putative hydrolase of the HAD superfamily [Salegentibacter flavus]
MKLNDIEHIYFDLDHTLWDFDKNSALAFEQMFSRRKISLKIEDFLEVYVPVNYKYWELYRDNQVSKEDLRIGRLKDSFDLLKMETSARTIEELSIEYIEFLPENNHLLDGSVEILNYLEANYQLHIITNGFEEVQHKKLHNSGISKFFATVTTSEEAGVKKPHSLIFETALNKASALPSKSLMIGDNLVADVKGAQDFGMSTIYFDYYRKKEKIDGRQIQTLNELRDYL